MKSFLCQIRPSPSEQSVYAESEAHVYDCFRYGKCSNANEGALFAMKAKELSSWFCVLTVLLVACGCGLTKSEDELRGQVFVVQKDRVTLKLSLVPIDVVEAEFITNRTGLKQKEAAQKIRLLRAQVGQLDAQVKQAEREKANLARSILSDAKEIDSAEETSRTLYKLQELGQAPKDVLKQVVELSNKIGHANDRIKENELSLKKVIEDLKRDLPKRDEVKQSLEAASEPIIFFEEPWPKTIATVTTDADGNFVTRLPKNRALFLAAHTSREVGNKTEHYCWLLPIQGLDWHQVLLNNNNMLGRVVEP